MFASLTALRPIYSDCRKDKEFLAPLAPSSGRGVGGEGPNFQEIQPLIPSPSPRSTGEKGAGKAYPCGIPDLTGGGSTGSYSDIAIQLPSLRPARLRRAGRREEETVLMAERCSCQLPSRWHKVNGNELR